MSVKRYDIEAYSYFEAANWELVESEVGDYVHASDYDEFRDCVAWMLECDECRQWLYEACWENEKLDLNEIWALYECARKAVEELL